MYLLLASAYQCMVWHILPLMPFSTIKSILTSVSNCNSTFVLSRYAYHANPGAKKKYAGLSSFISMHLLRQLLNGFANSRVFLSMFKS